jgi:hypothetical protein
MRSHRGIVAASMVAFAVLLLGVSGGTAEPGIHAGLVEAIDKAGGTFVMGDMGPVLPGGKSAITLYTMEVTPSTEFVRVRRASGAAPSGWIGGYVETRIPVWDVKPGDFVTVTSEGRGRRPKAIKVTVVDPSEP